MYVYLTPHFKEHFVRRAPYEQVQTSPGRDTEEHGGGPPGPPPTPERNRADFGCGELHQRQHQTEGKPGQDLGCVCGYSCEGKNNLLLVDLFVQWMAGAQRQTDFMLYKTVTRRNRRRRRGFGNFHSHSFPSTDRGRLCLRRRLKYALAVATLRFLPCADLQAMLSEPIDLAKPTRIFIKQGVLTKLGRRFATPVWIWICLGVKYPRRTQ